MILCPALGWRRGHVPSYRDPVYLVSGGAGTRLPGPGEAWSGAGLSSSGCRYLPGTVDSLLGPGEAWPGAGLSSAGYRYLPGTADMPNWCRGSVSRGWPVFFRLQISSRYSKHAHLVQERHGQGLACLLQVTDIFQVQLTCPPGPGEAWPGAGLSSSG